MLDHPRREPAPGVFRLVLPLPFPGLEAVNAYLLADGDGAVLVDCGIYDPAREDGGWSDLSAAIETTGYRVTDVRTLILTHAHIDHFGMAPLVVKESACEVWMHAAASADLEVLRDPDSARRRLADMLRDHGVGAAEIDELTRFEDWRAFVAGSVDPTSDLEGGEVLSAGGRQWKVVHTPGHAQSHVCLWSAVHGLLISGDHLLPKITPHIDFGRGRVEDPLGQFLRSLALIEDLDPSLVLPGHGRPFPEGAERARVVMRHHDRRLGAILQVVRKRPRSANEIVDEIFGEQLLNFDRRLALGEALAHLAYLRHRGEVERIESPHGYMYKKTGRRANAADDE